MSKELVLITGCTGFVGTCVTRAFVKAGYKVRGTSRSAEKIKAWEELNLDCKGNIEWFVVPDGAAAGAYDEAMKDAVYCIHTAGPYNFNPKDCQKDLLIPLVDGARTILSAAKSQPTLKHVVLTSSFAAVFDLNKGCNAGYTYTEEDWNPATFEELESSNFPPFVYCGAKVVEEKMFFDDKERKFHVTAINPVNVFGAIRQPMKSMADVNESNQVIWRLINSKEDDFIPPTLLPFHACVHEKDVVELHLKAITDPRLIDKRVIANGFLAFNTDWCETLRKVFANDPKALARIPTKHGKDPREDTYAIDTSFAKSILDRGDFIGIEETARDVALNLWEIEARFLAKA